MQREDKQVLERAAAWVEAQKPTSVPGEAATDGNQSQDRTEGPGQTTPGASSILELFDYQAAKEAIQIFGYDSRRDAGHDEVAAAPSSAPARGGGADRRALDANYGHRRISAASTYPPSKKGP